MVNQGPPTSLGAVSAALRTTTEYLVGELAHPHDCAPDWNTLEWDIARAVAAMQGISMLLSRKLRWRGPGRWEQFLEEQRAQNLQREERVADVLSSIDTGARREGIRLVGLKGSALREFHVYQPGDRPMADIDLLMRHEDFDAAARIFQSIGYREIITTARHAVFGNCDPQAAVHIGEHIDNPLKIELHTLVADALPLDLVDITSRLAPRNPAPGLTGYASKGALLAHLALHAAGNMRAHALRAIQIQDIALLAPLLEESDWGELDGYWWAFPSLSLAQRYFGAPVPANLMRSLRQACPPLLARAAERYRMTDVSWANLHISAFPGIEWSRNVPEALRYARSRLVPDKQARTDLAAFTRVQPQFNDIPWYGVSHRKRIFRWMLGRAPRVQTLWTVQRVLTRASS
jgi:hypothetical protein